MLLFKFLIKYSILMAKMLKQISLSLELQGHNSEFPMNST